MTYTSITSELSALNYPYPVKHKTHGIGQLVYVTAPANGNSLYANIDFESGSSKVFALKVLIDSNLLEMPDDIKPVLTEAQSIFFTTYETAEQKKREATRLAYEQKKQEEEDKKNEAKYQANKTKHIQDFERLVNRETVISTASEFYYGLGWMTKNCGTFACALPDYLLPYFEREFGTDYKPRTVDSRKRTVNGNPMQWATSMNASIKKSAQNMVPACLTKHLSTSGTSFADTEFIRDLVTDYGFKFGKTQDIDQIRGTIPTEYLTYFENGYAE